MSRSRHRTPTYSQNREMINVMTVLYVFAHVATSEQSTMLVIIIIIIIIATNITFV